MNKFKLLKEILEKYNVVEPLPENIKGRMLKAKKAVLINILKEHKQYSFFIFLILSVYFFSRWLGMGLTLAKSTAIVIISSLTTAALITTGSYFAINKIITQKAQVQDQRVETIPEKKETVLPVKKEDAARPKPVPIIEYKLEILPFKHDNKTKKAAHSLIRNIKTDLVKLKGKSAARIVYNMKAQKKPDKLLTGSIVMVDDIYMISAKITNPETSQVLMFINEETQSEQELKKIAAKIARLVAAKL